MKQNIKDTRHLNVIYFYCGNEIFITLIVRKLFRGKNKNFIAILLVTKYLVETGKSFSSLPNK